MASIEEAWFRYRRRLHLLNGLRSQGSHCPLDRIVDAKMRLEWAAKGIKEADLQPRQSSFEFCGPGRRDWTFADLERAMDGSEQASWLARWVGRC